MTRTEKQSFSKVQDAKKKQTHAPASAKRFAVFVTEAKNEDND